MSVSWAGTGSSLEGSEASEMLGRCTGTFLLMRFKLHRVLALGLVRFSKAVNQHSGFCCVRERGSPTFGMAVPAGEG